MTIGRKVHGRHEVQLTWADRGEGGGGQTSSYQELRSQLLCLRQAVGGLEDDVVDPISIIVMALVKGAATALARNVVNENYNKLRGQIVERYGPEAQASIAQLEQTPDSEHAQRFVEQALRNAGAQNDHQLAALAEQALSFMGDGQGVASLPERSNPAEAVFRSGGMNALSQILQAHIDRVTVVRANQQLDDADLLSARIKDNENIPRDVRDSAAELHAQIRRVVQQVAERIEDTRYREVEATLSSLDGSMRVLERSRQLIRIDKGMHVSYETLRLAVEFFGELNQTVLRRIAEEDVSPSQLSNMMFGNAVMIYEVTDFVIEYIKAFLLTNEHEALHKEAMEAALRARRSDAELEDSLDKIDPEVRSDMLEDIHDRASALDELESQWDQYLDEIRDLQALIQDVKGRVPTLEAIRKNACNQITVLQVTAMLRFLRRNSNSIRGAVETVQGLRLARLSSERVRALVGVVENNG